MKKLLNKLKARGESKILDFMIDFRGDGGEWTDELFKDGGVAIYFNTRQGVTTAYKYAAESPFVMSKCEILHDAGGLKLSLKDNDAEIDVYHLKNWFAARDKAVESYLEKMGVGHLLKKEAKK